MRSPKFIALALITSATFAAQASGNLLVNGSFEDQGSAVLQGWGGHTFGNGYTDVMPGWTVELGNVDTTGQASSVGWGPAADGNWALDLNGWEAGKISQSFATVAGQKYLVSFQYSRNAISSPDSATAIAQAGSTSLNIVANANDGFGNQSAYTWKPASFEFIADSSMSTLSFAATSHGNGGVYLDGISVTAVPEPGTWALLAAGLGAVGFAAKRRRAR